MPVYDGGLAASQVRQAKETLTQMRVLLDRVRTQGDTGVVAAWVTNEGAKISLSAAESEVRAATVALSGVQKEALAGQRTTLDVLNSQQDLTAARARLINAQRDRVVASYTLLASDRAVRPRQAGAQDRRATSRTPTIIRCATPGTGCAPHRGSSPPFAAVPSCTHSAGRPDRNG